MRKHLSPARLAANRHNALKSTGPKTPAGKAVCKWNALSHGLMARAVVVHSFKLRESTRQFRALLDDFRADLAPVGAVEDMLVVQITQAAWRLRRARQAESGEIADNVDRRWWRRLNWPAEFPSDTPLSQRCVFDLQRSVEGNDYLKSVLTDTFAAFKEKGELTGVVMNILNRRLTRPNEYRSMLEYFREQLAADPGPLSPAQHRQHCHDLIARYFIDELDELERVLRSESLRCGAEETARKIASQLPARETLDKILRYESALERQFYQALDHLQRIQHRRLSAQNPPPTSPPGRALQAASTPQPKEINAWNRA